MRTIALQLICIICHLMARRRLRHSSRRITAKSHKEITALRPYVCRPTHSILGISDAFAHQLLSRERHINYPELIHTPFLLIPNEDCASSVYPFFIIVQPEINIHSVGVAPGLRCHGIRIAEDDLIDYNIAVLNIGAGQLGRVGVEASNGVDGRCRQRG